MKLRDWLLILSIALAGAGFLAIAQEPAKPSVAKLTVEDAQKLQILQFKFTDAQETAAQLRAAAEKAKEAADAQKVAADKAATILVTYAQEQYLGFFRAKCEAAGIAVESCVADTNSLTISNKPKEAPAPPAKK